MKVECHGAEKKKKKLKSLLAFFSLLLAVFSDFSMSDNDFRKWERVRLGERDRERMRERVRERKEEVECERERKKEKK